jgi:hypothetical protein
MVVRITASAADASSAWDLKCDLREQMLEWINAEHPGALPRVRTAGTDARARDRAEARSEGDLAVR